MLRLALVFVLGLALGAGGFWAAGMLPSHGTPYAGEDERPVASLSPADIAALRAGEGWGLAKPAELNDHPGPLHVIELADDLALSPDQRGRIEAAFGRMRAAAVEAGEALIAAERALDEGFERGNLDRDTLRALLDRAAAARSRLREVHLAAHLEITPLLSDAQRERYAELRGYNGNGGHAHGGH